MAHIINVMAIVAAEACTIMVRIAPINKNRMIEKNPISAKQKMKSHRGACKRFKITGSGKVKRNKAYKSHILTKKSQKRKRGLRKATTLTSADLKRIKAVLSK